MILFLVFITGTFINAFAYRIEYDNNVVINQPEYEDLYND